MIKPNIQLCESEEDPQEVIEIEEIQEIEQ